MEAPIIVLAFHYWTPLQTQNKVRPTRHLNRRETQVMEGEDLLLLSNYVDVSFEVCTYSPDVTADHETDVLGERMNQMKQSRTRVWITGQHQTLRPANMEYR